MTRCSPHTSSISNEHGQLLSEPVALAWRTFDRVANLTCRVFPAVPILFFGDLAAYRASPLRVVTVGLNPSLHEFPASEPFRRFPLADGNRELSRYLDAMSAYFCTNPYSAWFNSFEPLLNGLGASYYPPTSTTALHTDMCSPVATDPTWSQLDMAHRATLEADGGPLWHVLLEELRPQIVAISVAKAHLERIVFPAISDWEIVHTFTKKANGTPRSRPYEIRARWYDVGGERSLFGFGSAGITPFQLLTDCQKHQTGKILLQQYHRHGIQDEGSAHVVEAALTGSYPGLTNVAAGHGTSDFGFSDAEHLNQRYAEEEIPIEATTPTAVASAEDRYSPGEIPLDAPLVTIKITRASLVAHGSDVYETVRRRWVLGARRLWMLNSTPHHVLAILEKQCIAVYAVGRGAWKPDPKLVNGRQRYYFTGEPANEIVQARYVGKRFSDRSQFPVRAHGF